MRTDENGTTATSERGDVAAAAGEDDRRTRPDARPASVRSPAAVPSPASPAVAEPSASRPVAGGAVDVPTYVGPLRAALARPMLLLLSLILVAAPALTWVYTTPATYRAQSEILVGRIDVEANAVPGFVAAVQQLAGTYARLVATSDVAALTAKRLNVPVDRVRRSVTASPVPESSIIAIEATADNQEAALALVEASSQSLIEYVRAQSTPPSADDATLKDYRQAAVDLNLARSRLNNAQRALDRAVDTGTAAQRRTAEAALAEAEADVGASQLRVDTLGVVFANNQRGGTERNSLQAIDEPVALGSNRASQVQLAVAVSLVLGLALGFALVTLRANLPGLRTLRDSIRRGEAQSRSRV